MVDKILTSKDFDGNEFVGSLVRVSNANKNGTKYLSFSTVERRGQLNIKDEAIFLYLGKEKVSVINWYDERDETETRYKFLYDNKIIYSVDPERFIEHRSFNWELIETI